MIYVMDALNSDEVPAKFGGGPLGLGDPDDRRLRKTEKLIIIPKMLREEADKKCAALVVQSLECAKEAGLLVGFKCRLENEARDECIRQWLSNSEFVSQVTENYLAARSHYRRTGEPLIKYKRGRKDLPKVETEGPDYYIEDYESFTFF